jgi:hemerythrin
MRPAFEWTADFETGIAIVDEQHQGLVTSVNKLVAAVIEGEGAGQVAFMNSLQSFLDYAAVHFETEERIMEQAGYPKIEEHKKIHKEFAESFLSIQQLLIDKRELPTIQTAYFLVDWVNHHILVEDKKMATFVKAHTS